MRKLHDILSKRFSDRVDSSFEISFFEYGIVRDPKTGLTLYLDNYSDTGKPNYVLDWSYISVEDVIEALSEMPQGYFDYIGQEKEEVIDNVRRWPRDLANDIHSINSYNSYLKSDSRALSLFAVRRFAREES